MAVRNIPEETLNINCPDSYIKKVYVNPNFSKPTLNIYHSNTIMHVNPKFSNLVSNVQCIQNKNKIYVNPNFIKSRNIIDNSQHMPISANNEVISDNRTVINNSMTTNQQQSVGKQAMAQQVSVAQSRYSLVRKNDTLKPLREEAKNTFKLNKYKTVPWKDIKSNLDSVTKKVTNNNFSCKPRFETNSLTHISKKVSSSSMLNNCKNKFQLINYNNVLSEKQNKTKMCADTYKKLKFNHISQSRVKKIKGHFMKNNIPCPQFRKFGKCLRNARGACDFLHDKKHISICRKFIKGLCHDKDCLLSHDLTTKKMPTCYFYLKGSCTKAECPYLHVKLNEKTKICPDFVKGYCEKGSKCLQRHVNVTGRAGRTFQKKGSCENKYNENDINKTNANNVKSFLIKDKINSDYRYYEKHGDDSSTNKSCDVMKPTRCKLGTLPSFIQF